jgi:predicted nucleotidyltransferase
VRSFKFDEDHAYSKADVDAVRRQLDGSHWNAIAQIHKREPREDVDVYICMEDGKPCGITVIAAQARELTFVNIVGSIDIDRLAQLQGEFGIPDLSQAQ